MSLVAALVVATSGVLLITFTGVALTKPATAEKFLMRFASSAKTHYLEQALRLLFGAALVVSSPAMWQARLFWLVGYAVIVSSIALMIIPWQWHHRLGRHVLPVVVRHLRLYAAGCFAFGTLVLYGLFADGGAV